MERVIIEAAGLKKAYDGKKVLNDVSFSIKEGETVALIGSSGTGKTTLFNVLTAAVHQDSGAVRIDGRDISEYNNRTLAKKIGLMRQQFDLVDQLSVLNNVLAGKLSEWSFAKSLFSFIYPADKPLAEAVLKRVGLSDKIYERTSNLSGGEQQRVALARLLIQAPDIILADEPIASLDPALSESVIQMLVKLTEEDQITLVSSLHSVEYAMKYFKRIIGLKDGKVRMDMAPEKITKQQLKELYELEGNRHE